MPATGGYADSRHYYFTSSMPVVTGMVQNNGAGDQFGFRAAVYGYTEAMYNHYGRGFQGFRTITSWLAALDTTRQTQTRTTYSQKFPLTGKTESIDVVVPPTSLGANPRLISRETDSWICNLANRGACPQGDSLATPTGSVVYAPVLDKQHAENHDLATGALVDHADTVNASATTSTTSGWDVYGNLRNQIVTRADDGTAIVSSHITRTTNLYPTDGTFTNCMLDVASWRIADLCQSTVISSIAYAAGHALPAGASAPVRTVAMTYQWNADRTPIARTIQPNVTDEQQTTNWTYPSPSYGLPNRMYISPARMTQFAYTKDGTSAAADGYFALTTTNALSQATTTEHSPRDGQVTRTIDPNQLKTVVTYDVFGRATKMDYQDASGGVLMPSLSIAYTRCTGGNPSTCPAGYAEDANQDWAAWRVTQVQAGSPTTVDWYDVLGRAVKHAERGFSGSFIASVTDYDEMNTVEQTSTPYFGGASIPYFTGWSYDRASRPTLKQSPGGDSDLVHTVLTSYSYSGHKTTVKVRGSGVSATCSASTNLCMDMSRTYDVLGRLEQTTQNNGATANYATTNYWYDGAGNAVAIQDAEANVITATYDNRGRRIGVVDPDAGSKTFTYNGLNELQTQTDARGVQTVFTYDALSRLRSRTATDNAAIAPLPKVIRDTWVFDPPGVNGGAGLLNYVKRETGPSTAAMTQVHIETDSYEQNTKRLSTQTQTLDGQASAWITGHGYDTNGREQTTTYPSGQVVKRGYTTYGELNQLSDNATGSVYWNATAKDAWGHLTGETYVGGLEGVHVTQPSTGQYLKMGWEPIGSPSASHRFDYLYDSFGNLTTQYATQVNFQTTETYAYDGLQRLKTATRTANVPGSPAAVTYQYGPSGNLWAKSDVSIAIVGGYQYGQNGCGPHAVSRVSYDLSGGAWTYQCDANGNVIGGNTLANGRYDFENRPWYIERLAGGGLPAGQATYMYGPSGDRFKEVTNTQTTWYGPAGFERTFTSPQTTDRIELGPVTLLKVGALASVRPNLKDRLGSTVAMGNSNGTLWQLRSYDAFGKPRNGDQSDRPTGTLDLMVPTLRGFTGHEHVDDLRLIHMNGRMYDPLLGRFLSVDPVIQFPSNSQSLNPYSYILNNPLAGSDPTGYQACTGSHIDRFDGSSCAGQGVSGGGSNSPDPMQQLSAKGMAVQANVWNQHVAAMTAKGEASKPISGNPADIGGSGKTVANANLSVTQLDGMTVTPTGDALEELNYDNWRRQDTNALLTAPLVAATGFLTGTNPWHENAPGDDSIQSATFPFPVATGLKAAVGLAALRNVSRVEQAYEVVSDISPSALKFLSTGRETQVYLGYRDGQTIYCGISCNVAARQIQHGAKYDIQAISPMMARGQARAIEQAMILRNPQFMNEINSISPRHAYYNDAVRWGESWLKANGY